jgi:hypothetical protein
MDMPDTVEDTMAAILVEGGLSVVMEEVGSVGETEGAAAAAEVVMEAEEAEAEAAVNRELGKFFCRV